MIIRHCTEKMRPNKSMLLFPQKGVSKKTELSLNRIFCCSCHAICSLSASFVGVCFCAHHEVSAVFKCVFVCV